MPSGSSRCGRALQSNKWFCFELKQQQITLTVRHPLSVCAFFSPRIERMLSGVVSAISAPASRGQLHEQLLRQKLRLQPRLGDYTEHALKQMITFNDSSGCSSVGTLKVLHKALQKTVFLQNGFQDSFRKLRILNYPANHYRSLEEPKFLTVYCISK